MYPLQQKSLHPPVYSPDRFCCPAPQRGSSPGHAGWPGWETHPSSCPVSWRCLGQWRRTPAHSSRHRGRKPHPETGTALDLLCPISEWNTEHSHKPSFIYEHSVRLHYKTFLQTDRFIQYAMCLLFVFLSRNKKSYMLETILGWEMITEITNKTFSQSIKKNVKLVHIMRWHTLV